MCLRGSIGTRGIALGDEAIRADGTVTFVGLKTGLFIGEGPEFAGTVFFDDLEIVPGTAGATDAAARAHRGSGDSAGAAAPAARLAQGGLRPGTHRRRGQSACRGPRAWRARRACASGRDSSTVAVAAGERGGDRRRPTRAHLPAAHRRERVGRGDRARGRRRRGAGVGSHRRGRRARSPWCSIPASRWSWTPTRSTCWPKPARPALATTGS